VAAWADYQARIGRPLYLERERPTYLEIGLYTGGALATPSSGTISIYDASETAKVSADAVTVTGSKATYTLLAATVASSSYGPGWRVEWSLTMPDGYVHVIRQQASLVRCRLAPMVTDADLLARHPDLTTHRPSTWTSWETMIEQGWIAVEDRLESLGRRPYLVLSPEALRAIHLAATLGLIARGLCGAGDPANRWTALAEHYEAEAEAAWSRLHLVYDEDDDGRDDGRRRRGVTSIWLAGRD
jgi:hypothetical protein